MSAPEVYNFEVSESNFNQTVLMNSYKLPVFTLFMSPSIGACITLENALSKYAEEFAGQFILARLDIDMYMDMRDEYDIKNIPTLKVFKDGEMVHQEIGLMTDEEIAELFRKFDIFRASDDLRARARDKHLAGDTPAAVQILTQAIQMDPTNTKVAMDMCQIFLDVNMLEEAVDLFNKLPDKDKDSEIGRSLVGQVTFKNLAAETPGKEVLSKAVAIEPNDFDARFDLAVCFIADHQYEEAMDQLLTMLEQDRSAKDGAAQELAITLINMLEGNNQKLASDFRRILSNMLAQ